MELVEAAAGLRPGTPDNLPRVGPSGVNGLIWATGHYRNGILLAPLAANAVADLLDPPSASRAVPDAIRRARSTSEPQGGRKVDRAGEGAR